MRVYPKALRTHIRRPFGPKTVPILSLRAFRVRVSKLRFKGLNEIFRLQGLGFKAKVKALGFGV